MDVILARNLCNYTDYKNMERMYRLYSDKISTSGSVLEATTLKQSLNSY